MSADDYVKLLAVKGDPLEKLIVTAWSELHQVVTPYAGIWGQHILRRRLPTNPTQVDPEWMDFAGSHYTAIVRVYQAFRKRNEIERITNEIGGGDDAAASLLDLHDAVAAFWEHIGSAIDNLSAAWADAPPLQVKHPKENEVAPDGSPLDWMYDRRSQFIHSRLVPKGVEGGIPFFNLRLFDDKNTSWTSEYRREELVADFYPKLWEEFLNEIGKVWARLQSRLRGRDRKAIHFEAVEIPVFDVSSLKPSDIRIPAHPGMGPPPSNVILWNVPPSGTLH